jgi:hypothetical protein
MTSEIEHDIRDRLGRIEGMLEPFVERHDHAVFGNGKDGLLVRMDRVEQVAKGRTARWSAVVSVFSAVMSALAGAFFTQK